MNKKKLKETIGLILAFIILIVGIYLYVKEEDKTSMNNATHSTQNGINDGLTSM